MKAATLAAAVLAALAPGLALLAPAAGASNEIPEGIDWVNDWDRALAIAAERGVPLLVSFANDD
jgi:hypothetical protein